MAEEGCRDRRVVVVEGDCQDPRAGAAEEEHRLDQRDQRVVVVVDSQDQRVVAEEDSQDPRVVVEEEHRWDQRDRQEAMEAEAAAEKDCQVRLEATEEVVVEEGKRLDLRHQTDRHHSQGCLGLEERPNLDRGLHSHRDLDRNHRQNCRD